MIGEKWLPVVGYPGYEVSSLGQVRSYLRPGARGFIHSEPVILATHQNHARYLCLSLMKPAGGFIKRTVHRLVALAFLPDGFKPGLEVNHKDSNRANAALENLEWVTRGENCAHATRQGYGAKSKLTAEQREAAKSMCLAGVRHSIIRERFKIGHKYVSRLSREAKNQEKVQGYLQTLRTEGFPS